MDGRNDIELLRDYCANGAEDAFGALVARHVDLVYSAAVRQIRDPHLAQEVTQATFLLLARKGAAFDERTVVTAWLYRTARFVAAAALRAQSRRAKHLQEALRC
jgi:DNA-directed RNA polymerase specialized sigma24 family protein